MDIQRYLKRIKIMIFEDFCLWLDINNKKKSFEHILNDMKITKLHQGGVFRIIVISK